jgi:multiple sugar transport system substrate-binding protein
MKKVATLAAVLLSASITAAGCGAQSGTSSKADSSAAQNKPESAAAKPIEVQWMPITAYSLQSSDPKRVEYIKSSIETYKQSHPNVTLDSSKTYDGNAAQLFVLASQDRAPDSAMIDSYMMPNFLPYLQPLDDYFQKAGLKIDDFFPFSQNLMKGPDGKIYGIQFTTDVRVLYYRKDLVPNPPKTWDEVLETGKKLKDQGYDALLIPAGRAEASSITVTLPQFFAQGGELIDKEGKPVFGEGANRDKMLSVFQFLKTAADAGVIPKRSANIKNEADQNADIATGKVAMFLGGNWQVNQLKDLLGADFSKWGVAPIPSKDGTNHVSMTGGWAWGIFTKDKDKQQAAFDFLLQTFINDKGMANWCNIGGYLPTRKSVYDTADYKSNELTKTFREYMDKYGKARPATSEYAKISEQLQIATSSVVSGTLSPEQALDNAWKTLTQK